MLGNIVYSVAVEVLGAFSLDRASGQRRNVPILRVSPQPLFSFFFRSEHHRFLVSCCCCCWKSYGIISVDTVISFVTRSCPSNISIFIVYQISQKPPRRYRISYRTPKANDFPPRCLNCHHSTPCCCCAVGLFVGGSSRRRRRAAGVTPHPRPRAQATPPGTPGKFQISMYCMCYFRSLEDLFYLWCRTFTVLDV